MTQTIAYADPAGAWSETLATVVRTRTSWVERASMLEVGQSHVVINDPAASVGHSGDAIKGLKAITSEESDCAVARIFTGTVGPRDYGRGEQSIGPGRDIELDAVDLNARLGFLVIDGADGVRPRESISARMTWLLASAYLSTLVVDAGYVDYPTSELDASDYRTRYPADVISDMREAAAVNAYVYWDTTAVAAALWFRDPNTSTDFESTLRISNVAGDVDATTTFAPSDDVRLHRDPGRVAEKVVVPYTNGFVSRERVATATAFGYRGRVAPSSNFKTSAKAQTYGDRYLVENKTEEDSLTPVKIRVPSSAVNLVRAGQRIQARFQHLPGYESFVWCRVTQRTITQPFDHDLVYDLELELSPQEAFISATCDSGLTATNLAIGKTVSSLAAGPGHIYNGPWAPQNLATSNDDVPPAGSETTYSSHGSTALSGLAYPEISGSFNRGWAIDLGSAKRVGIMWVLKETQAGSSWIDTVWASDDGTTWSVVSAAMTPGSSPADDPPGGWRKFTFTPETHRYWGIGVIWTAVHGLAFGFSYFGAVNVDEWRVFECPE